MSPAETALGVVALVAVAAFVMRMFSGSNRDEGSERKSAAAVVDEFLARESGREADEVGAAPEAVAITSDGWAFVPAGEEVQLIPPGDDDPAAPVQSVAGGMTPPVNPRTGKPLVSWKPGEHLDRGDLVAARVRRGAPDFDPWRLEALGRDREYRAWAFETEDAARAALALLETRIVRTPVDEDGEPRPPTDGDFAEARRRDEQTEHELDLPDEG